MGETVPVRARSPIPSQGDGVIKLLTGIVIGIIFTLAWQTAAQARPPVPGPVFAAVRHYWKDPVERRKAFDVVSCETGGRYNTTARNGQYLGIFQAGEWFRSRYGFGSSADAQARSAYRGWRELGWSQWECA